MDQVSYSFDVSVISLYIGLLMGKTILGIDRDMIANFRELFECFKKSKIAVWISTPSLVEMCMVDKNFNKSLLPDLEKLFVAGEVLTSNLVAVLREVSHDLQVHAAIWSAAQEPNGVSPLLIGDPDALDRCRILAIAEKQDRIAQALVAAEAGERPSSPGAPHLGIDAGTVPTFGGPGSATGPAAVQPVPPAPRTPTTRRDLADELRNRQFIAETVDGVDTVRELTLQAGEIDETRVPRWIQANAWRPDAPELAARALAPGQWNLLGVYVAPSDVVLAGAVFPTSSFFQQIFFNIRSKYLSALSFFIISW